jgi:hypothetical protein
MSDANRMDGVKTVRAVHCRIVIIPLNLRRKLATRFWERDLELSRLSIIKFIWEWHNILYLRNSTARWHSHVLPR